MARELVLLTGGAPAVRCELDAAALLLLRCSPGDLPAVHCRLEAAALLPLKHSLKHFGMQYTMRQ